MIFLAASQGKCWERVKYGILGCTWPPGSPSSPSIHVPPPPSSSPSPAPLPPRAKGYEFWWVELRLMVAEDRVASTGALAHPTLLLLVNVAWFCLQQQGVKAMDHIWVK